MQIEQRTTDHVRFLPDIVPSNPASIASQELIQVRELLYNPFTPRIVELFSGDGSGRLDFQRFLHMMSVFSSRASAEAKVVWAFALWDFDGARGCPPDLLKPHLYQRTSHAVAKPLAYALLRTGHAQYQLDQNLSISGRARRRRGMWVQGRLSSLQPVTRRLTPSESVL